MPRQTMCRIAVLSLALTFGLASHAAYGRPTDGRAAAGSDCATFQLQPQLSWLFYGEWVNGGTELILPDTMAGRLLRYRRSGSDFHPLAVSTSATFTRPNSIHNTERGLVVLDLVDRLVALNSGLQPTWETRLADVHFPHGDRVEAFLSFIGVDADFLGITALANGQTHEKWLGIARLRLGDSPRLERVRTLPSMFTNEGAFYLSHEGPYLAKTNEAIYALIFDRNPHIERLLPEPRTLATFPAGYTSPMLGFNTRDNTLPASRTWEASTAPVALFGRERFLYLLTRQPRVEGGTRWMLFQIDPQRDHMVRSVELPTRASHVVVIPGSREWAVVEKGRMVAVGDRFAEPAGSVRLIRSSLIEDPSVRADFSQCLETQK
jgi:hypothetical protein